MYESKDYLTAVRIGLDSISNAQIKNSKQFGERFMNLIYSLFSADVLQLFNEFKRIFPSYMELILSNENIEPPVGYANHAYLLRCNLAATVFQFYAGNASIDDIKETIRLLNLWSRRAINVEELEADNSKLLKLAELILKDKDSFFTAKFKLPFSLPLPDGLYEINTIGDAKAISVEHFSVIDETSRVGDSHFSRVQITIKGYSCFYSSWMGPNLENENSEPRYIQQILIAVNKIILHTKLIDESLRLVLVSHKDLEHLSYIQYDGDGDEFQYLLKLGFDGWLKRASKQELSENQVNTLALRLKNRKLLLHEELYAQALIERGNMNFIGAFYLLNSASEAMIDNYLILLAKRHGKLEEYERFMKGDSFCSKCELFKAQTTIKPPRASSPPSPFQILKFLQEITLATPQEVSQLKKSLGKVRSDKMRNDLSHGRKSEVPVIVVDDAILGIKEMSKSFSALF